MNTPLRLQSRRNFLTEVGCGMITASVGIEMARELCLGTALAEDVPAARLGFGSLEPLVRLMQDTPVAKLLPVLVEKLRSGTPLQQLVAAGALANARSFGGDDYVGFHTMMALAPGYHISQELPAEQQPLPVFKVLYRNTNRLQETGGSEHETMHLLSNPTQSPADAGSFLREAVRSKDLPRAEAAFAQVSTSPEDTLNAVLQAMQDDTEVHRVVLPYRAWDLLSIIGPEQASTLLRQSVRYCVKAENSWAGKGSRELLPKLLETYKLLGAKLGTRPAEDQWVATLSETIFNATPEQAAAAAAAALAEGFLPDAVGEAISLAANQLLLRDQGRVPSQEVAGKPIGSVHGDSIGVHACDSAGAWRNLARVARPQNTFACLILGAYQAALDRTNRGGDFSKWEPLPLARHLSDVKSSTADNLLADLDEAIRGNLQGRASGIVQRYGSLGFAPEQIFALCRRYAISEDGALHAEKFYRTVTEEFQTTRPAFRGRQLVALARVTASEYGRPAPGMAQARELLKL